jgi:uncharacterized Zn-binding protein involved in type VI secretion
MITTMGRSPACRIGDLDVPHCSGMHRAQGSGQYGENPVLVNKIPWSCVSHLNSPHLKPCGLVCCPHTFPITKGSTTVFVNGLAAGRVGDPTCTAVATGSGMMFRGNPVICGG